MKNLLLAFCFFFSIQLQAQFIQMGPYDNSNFDVEVMGKDGNGLLYGSGPSGVFRKVDELSAPWEFVASSGGQLIMTEINGFKMYNHYFSDLYSSLDGQNWAVENLPGGSENVVFLKYLDNNHLIFSTDLKTYVSTNGGASFQDFLNDPIVSIAWDYLNSRYVYTTYTGLFAKTSISATPIELYLGSMLSSPSYPNYGHFISIDNKGVVYTTAKTAFPFIKKFDPSTNTYEDIYPAASSYPIHARGLFSTKTGRTYCIGWSNAGSFLISDDPENNFISNIPQNAYNSYFLDKAGFLYLNADANGSSIQGKYAKSAYSVRQPVFFKRMEDIMNEGFNGKGYVFRAINNALLSIDTKGHVYESTDNGELWDSISKVPIINGNFPLGFAYQHPNGKIFVGNSGPAVRESTDNGITWQNSSLSLSFSNGRFIDAAYKANGNYSFFIKSDLILRSQNNGDSLEIISSLNNFLPNFGIVNGFTCIEITNQGTVLIGGRINNGYVYRSTNNLDSMTMIQALGALQQEIYDIYQDASGKIWMGTYLGLLFSNDDGLTWTKDTNYPELSALEIIENGDGKVIVVGNSGNYMWNNNTWERISYGYNDNFGNLYLDPVSSILFSKGNYKTVSVSPEFYTPIFSRQEDNSNDIALDFYPNPSTGLIQVNNNLHEEGEFIIFNSLGQIVLHENFSAQQDKISLSIQNNNPGIYFLLKKTASNAISKQLILK